VTAGLERKPVIEGAHTVSVTYRLLFVDVDGTLIRGGETISAVTLATLREARAAGCDTVICTGRTRWSSRNIVAQLGRDGWGVVMGGAVVAHWATGRVLHCTGITSEIAAEVSPHIFEGGVSPLCFGVEDDDRLVYASRLLPPPDWYVARNVDRIVWVDDVVAELPGPPAMVAAYGPSERTRAVAADLRARYASVLNIQEAAIPGYGCWSVEVHAADADKGIAAEVVARELGVPREATIAIGDHLNDIGMLRWAGLGIAMGDAEPETRAAAVAITGTVADNGVAQAVRRYVLGL
jgi:hydroxymethylpyrimidine pyrophosphatase-like HAD family hydrolase